jgi:HAD superfamily hydrolase (TIGR01509 family)
MEPFGLVIFDCDGVVVDSEILACTCLRGVLADYGVDVTLEEIFERFLGRSFSVVSEHFSRKTGEKMPEGFLFDYRNRLFDTFTVSLKPIPDVEQVLKALNQPYCLASSSDQERIRLTLSVTGLEHYFVDRVYNSAMVERGKPAPDLFLYAAERMHSVADRTLVIEDTVSGVRAGKAAGMTVWGFVGGSHCAGRDVGSMLASAGADRVFHSMADFLRLQ